MGAVVPQPLNAPVAHEDGVARPASSEGVEVHHRLAPFLERVDRQGELRDQPAEQVAGDGHRDDGKAQRQDGAEEGAVEHRQLARGQAQEGLEQAQLL